MTKLTKLATFCATITLALQAQAFELTHPQGTISLDETPKTIVTYDLGVLDTLNFLGVEVAGMPDVHERQGFEQYKDIKAVGTLFEPDYDAVKALEPDLIFASRRTAAKQEELGAIAPTAYYSVDPFNYFEDFKRNNLNLAKAFSKEAEATAKLEAIEADLKKLQDLNQGKTGVFLMAFDNGGFAALTRGDLFGFTYDAFGLTSVLPARDPKAPRQPRPEPGSPEAKAAAEAREQQLRTVVEIDPDWFVVMDRRLLSGTELGADKALAEHPILSNASAVKNNRVIHAHPNEWYLIAGGLDNFHKMVQELLEQMQ